MRDRIWRTAATVVVLSGVVVGCAGSGSDTPAVPPVPPIGDARDAAGTDPCALLAPEQLAAVGLAGGAAASAAQEGPRCSWRGETGVLDVTLHTGDGLGTLAEHSEPTTTRVRLAGYPALETFTGRGEFCQYDVGIADRQVLMAALDGTTADSCAVLQRVVPVLVGGLPAAEAR